LHVKLYIAVKFIRTKLYSNFRAINNSFTGLYWWLFCT